MHRDASDPAERLEYTLDSTVLEPFAQVPGDRLSNDRIPALIIQLNSLIEQREEEVTLSKVPLQLLSNIVMLPHFLVTVGDLNQLKTNVMQLEVARFRSVVVIDAHQKVNRVLLCHVELGERLRLGLFKRHIYYTLTLYL